MPDNWHDAIEDRFHLLLQCMGCGDNQSSPRIQKHWKQVRKRLS